MTLKTDIISDISTFTNTDEFGTSVIWTPKGGIAQPAFDAILNEIILHGDPNQDQGVVQPDASINAATTDLSGIKEGDNISANSVNYETFGAAYLDLEKSGMSFVDLRLVNETLI